VKEKRSIKECLSKRVRKFTVGEFCQKYSRLRLKRWRREKDSHVGKGDLPLAGDG